MTKLVPTIIFGTLGAILFFPHWGLVIHAGGWMINPTALVGVLVLGFLCFNAIHLGRKLEGTLRSARKEQTREKEENTQALENQDALKQSLDLYREAGEIGQTLSSVLNKDQLLRRVLSSILKITRCDLGYLTLYDYNANEFCYETGMGMDVTMLKQSKYPVSESVIKRILEKRATLTLPFSRGGQQDECFSIEQSRLDRFQAVVWVFVIPLVVENNVLGIITLYANEQSANLINNETPLFSLVIHQAAIALGSAIQCEYAVLDRLTLLYNHEYFQRRLLEEIHRCQRYKSQMSLIMLDIDHFKHFNDSYGHQIGDQVLRLVSQTLKKNIRVVDLCARYGGEEFALIFPETPLTVLTEDQVPGEVSDPSEMGGAVMKADQLRHLIESTPVTVQGKEVQVTVSMGIAGWKWPEDQAVEREVLIKRADDLLYAAKKAGRNRVCW